MAVRTAVITGAGSGMGAMRATGQLAAEPMMDVSNVAGTVACMAGLPLEANLPFATVMATNLLFVGRG